MGKGMKPSHLIRDASNFGSEALNNRKPSSATSLPTIEELEQRFNEIYSKRPKTVPEPENAGNKPEKTEIPGLCERYRPRTALLHPREEDRGRHGRWGSLHHLHQ
jgi:hypothetical protein